MDRITIKDLAVLSRIGVPDEERAKPQRLLISLEMRGDFSRACQSDRIDQTINYYDASRRIVDLCRTQSHQLIEKLASEIATLILREFRPEVVHVQVKKFILSDARYVAFELERNQADVLG